MMKFALRLFSMLLLPGLVFADSVIWGEQEAADWMARMVRVYIKLHGGVSPKNWDDLDPEGAALEGFSYEYARARGGASLKEKYIFVNEVMNIPQIGKANVVLIRTSPIETNNSPDDVGRLLVYAVDGTAGEYGVTEVHAEKMFADAGRILPGKGSKPDRQSMVNGKGQYTAAEAENPRESPDQSAGVPSHVTQSKTAGGDASGQSEKSSEIPLVWFVALGGVILGVLGWAFFFRKRR